MATERVAYVQVTTGVDCQTGEKNRPEGPRYTRDNLRRLLQLLGCKPRDAQKITSLFFQTALDNTKSDRQRTTRRTHQLIQHNASQVAVCLTRPEFHELISSSASEYGYRILPSSDELKAACSLREGRRFVVVLLCGTSGSGKSTLASILASRLGITTVVSTDSIRHMLRSFQSKEEAPLLWASTYQAGDSFDVKKTVRLEEMTEHERTIKGYKAQCELIVEHVDRLIEYVTQRGQSLVVEGVHLSINFVIKLMQKHPHIIPLMIYIKNENKHIERMAVRAKYMTLDPNKNRYVKHMKHIRWIQEFLVRKADKHLVPKVDNTNVDHSVALIHMTILGCLKRMMKGEAFLDHSSNTARVVHSEYMQVQDHFSSSGQDVLDRCRFLAEDAGQQASTSSTPVQGYWDATPGDGPTSIDSRRPWSGASGSSSCCQGNGDKLVNLSPLRTMHPSAFQLPLKERWTEGDEAFIMPEAPSSDDEDTPISPQGSSGENSEVEVYLQEYGSIYETTTCDEHDHEDEDGIALGLRAWNGGMARALWPSFTSNNWAYMDYREIVREELGGANRRTPLEGTTSMVGT